LSSTLEKADLKFESTTSIDQSIHKLVAGRLDFCIDDRVVLYDAILRLYPDEINHFKFLPKPFGKKTPTGLLVSRMYPKAKIILDKFNKGLVIIKQNGEYDRIVQKYRMTR
jgi:polar amino acid transport system substrate-binding protein